MDSPAALRLLRMSRRDGVEGLKSTSLQKTPLPAVDFQAIFWYSVITI
jgi:hypothetical protein